MRIERKVGAGVAVLGSLLIAMSGAAPALAHTGSSARLATGGMRLSTTNATSTFFGGWAFTTAKAASVTAEYKQPKLTCGSATSGMAPLTALVTGTGTTAVFNAAGVLEECSGGTPAAIPVVQVGSTAKSGTKAPLVGDLLKSTVTTSATKTTATVQDLTKGHTFTLTVSVAGKQAASSEELVIDDSLVNTGTGKQLPVANFGKEPFSKGAVGGKPLGSVTPKGVAVNMETAKKVLQILTGALTGTMKNGFLTTWKHS